MTTDRSEMAREWQTKLGRIPPASPTFDAMDEDLRVAHANVIFEEALELIEALGCQVAYSEEIKLISVVPSDDGPQSLVEIAHESADLCYITETTACMLGIPTEEVFAEVHRANMTRILEDGTLLRHPKRTKHPAYVPPNIHSILVSATSADDA